MRMRILGCLVVAALALTGCSKNLVGVVVPDTGDASAYGNSMLSGARLAFDTAIKDGNTPSGFKVVYIDSGSDPKKAAAEAKRLYDAGALMVIGGATSAEAKAMIPVAEAAKGVLLSPSASEPGLAASSNHFFRVFPSDEFEAKLAARFLVTDRKAGKILVLKEDSLYTQGLLPLFDKEVATLGGKIVGELKIDTPDFETKLGEAITRDQPDALFIAGYSEGILESLISVRNVGYAGLKCSTSAIEARVTVSRGGDNVEGVYFPMVKVDLSSSQEPMKSFVTHFKENNFDRMPDLYAAHGYDAALVALQVLRGESVKSSDELMQRMLSMSPLQGVTGPLSFDAHGDSTHRPRMHQIVGGKAVEVPTPANG